MSTAASESTSRKTRSIDINGRKSHEKHGYELSTEEVLENDIREAAPLLHGRTLTAALAFVAGTGFTLFGCVALPYYHDFRR